MRNQETTFIYGLFDPRNYQLRYIGKSDNPQKRLEEHIKVTKSGKNLSRVHRWIFSLLKEKLEPSFEILEEVSADKWIESEIAWISECRKFGLDITNLTRGGDHPPSQKGKHSSEVTREKIRQKAIGRLRTLEERQKLSASKKGKSTWVKGKHLSEEHKRKIGLANSNKERSQEVVNKWKESRKGYTPSEETKRKTSESLKLAYREGRRRRKGNNEI